MKCPACKSWEGKIAFTKTDLGDSRRKLIRYQENDGYASAQGHIEKLTDDILRLQERLEEEETNLAAHQADEHDEPPGPTPSAFRPRLHEDDRYARTTNAVTLRLTRGGYSTSGQPLKRTADTDGLPMLGRLFHFPVWFADALCAQTDPDGFFPEKGGSTREAKSVCARCTVAAECLDYALANNERFGIWGGLSERERRQLNRLTTDTDHPADVDTTKESA